MPAKASPRSAVVRRAWMLFLAVGVVLLGLYLFVKPFAGSAPGKNVLGLAPVVAIFAGIRMHRPAAAFAWAASSRSGSGCSGSATCTPTATPFCSTAMSRSPHSGTGLTRPSTPC